MQNPWFDSLYHEFSTPLFRFIAKRLGRDRAAVEEVFEDTVVAGWKGYKTFKHKSSYFTWLCRIALNKIADYYRDQIHQNSQIVVPFIDSLADTDTKSLSPDEALALKELRASVNSCLQILPYEKRRLLWFRYWKDYSYEKIAEMTGLSIRAIEGRLYRAKHEFANLWSAAGNLKPKNP